MVLQNGLQESVKLSPLPDLIEHIAGEFAPAVMAIWGRFDVGEYVMATSTQRHVWHAAIAAGDDFLLTSKWLTRNRLKVILKRAYGNYPAGMVRLLSRLGPRAETREFYRAAHVALSRGDMLTRILQHLKTIDPHVVFAIAELPTDLISVRMASYALRRGVSSDEIAEMSWLVTRTVEVSGSAAILNFLSSSTNPVITIRKAIANLRFPSPPWKAEGLIPVQSAEELSQMARRLRNCLGDHDIFYSSCLDVQAGIAFYFVTAGSKPLLLKFTKFGGLGWYLDECRGEGNRHPTAEELEYIAGIHSHIETVWCRRLSYEMR
ncbi:hypothetical protein [Shinella zoogloeoides]|uniref:hypothetical protein n=1 Tax=Shinella zoogloeoides TaxID=352475 RepID=UPI001F56AEDE|nr:hypothetical protein [Shinella zoogloeoides]